MQAKAAQAALGRLGALPEAGAAPATLQERGNAAQVLLAFLAQQVSVAGAVYSKLSAKDYQRFSDPQYTAAPSVSLEFLDSYDRFKKTLSRSRDALGQFLQATVEEEALVLTYRGSNWRCPLWLLTSSSWVVTARTRALYGEEAAKAYQEYPTTYRKDWNARVSKCRSALEKAEVLLDRALRDLTETQAVMVEAEPQMERLVAKRLAALGKTPQGEPPQPHPWPESKEQEVRQA